MQGVDREEWGQHSDVAERGLPVEGRAGGSQMKDSNAGPAEARGGGAVGRLGVILEATLT